MGAWNTDSGGSIHAELIGRELVKSGHQLTVFTFYEHSIHGTAITNKDEDYVIRCFTSSKHPNVELDPIPFLRADYDFFIVEDLGMLPHDNLGRIFHWIKRKAKTVNVIHDGGLSNNPLFYQFDWDAIIGFDERYIRFLKEVYPHELLHQIPFPCHPTTIRDKKTTRMRLKLPLKKKIIFMFGYAARMGIETIPWIFKHGSDYPYHILIVSKDKMALTKGHRYSKIGNVEIREEIPTITQLYNYLNASDVLIFNKPSQPHVVISSTIFQCLGSNCPILARESNMVETLNEEILKFRNKKEFKECLIDVLEQRDRLKTIIKKAESYVQKNSSKKIAETYIELFKHI
jgi:hypothetical protein